MGDLIRHDTCLGKCGTGKLADECRMSMASLMQMLDARLSRPHTAAEARSALDSSAKITKSSRLSSILPACLSFKFSPNINLLWHVHA